MWILSSSQSQIPITVARKAYNLKLIVVCNPVPLRLLELIPFLFFGNTAIGVLLWFGAKLCSDCSPPRREGTKVEAY